MTLRNLYSFQVTPHELQCVDDVLIKNKLNSKVDSTALFAIRHS